MDGFGVSLAQTVTKERRFFRRSVFIVDREGRLIYVKYMPVLSQQPDYDEVIAEAKKALG